MRGNLFVKIFLGFWLVTTTILGSWMLATYYFESRPDNESADQRRPGPPHRFILRMIYDLQNLEEEEIRALASRVKTRFRISIYLLDRNNHDLLQRKVPPAVREVATQLQGSKRRVLLNTTGGTIVAHDIYRPAQGPLRAVFVFPPPQHNLLAVLGSNLWARISLAVLISGLVCYGLSRLVTNRLKALQQASRALATGDLDTRLQVRERGGDETDELARDFNSMARQLQERTQAQQRLLADVSHELRSPLTRLRLALTLAQQNQDKSTQYLQRIEQEAERLEELIGQLLATRAQELLLDTHVDLVRLLQQLCADAEFEGTSQRKRVVFHHSMQQAIIASSGDLLHKSFENLLRNAVHHTAPGSQVTASITRADDSYCIRIEDQGAGVPADALDKIFEAFYRVDTARARSTGGYGLGLAIARQAILRHGGTIRADNTGGGLAMTVTLPIECS